MLTRVDSKHIHTEGASGAIFCRPCKKGLEQENVQITCIPTALFGGGFCSLRQEVFKCETVRSDNPHSVVFQHFDLEQQEWL